MSIGFESSIKQIVLSTSAFGPRELEQITSAISQNPANHRELREAVQELKAQETRSPAMSARLGVCQHLLGSYTEAIQTLSHSDGGALTNFFLGKAHLALDQYSEAKKEFTNNPNDEESIIWFGRRTAYLANYKEAITIYSDGIKKFPNSPKLSVISKE